MKAVLWFCLTLFLAVSAEKTAEKHTDKRSLPGLHSTYIGGPSVLTVNPGLSGIIPQSVYVGNFGANSLITPAISYTTGKALFTPSVYGTATYGTGFVHNVGVVGTGVPVPVTRHVGESHEYRQVNQNVAVPVPTPYPVTVTQHVPVPQPYKVEVPRPYAVPVHVKVPYDVPRPYAVKVPQKVEYPVHNPVPVDVPRPYIVYHTKNVPYEVQKPVFVKERVNIQVPVPQPYPVEVPTPVAYKVPHPVFVKEQQIVNTVSHVPQVIPSIAPAVELPSVIGSISHVPAFGAAVSTVAPAVSTVDVANVGTIAHVPSVVSTGSVVSTVAPPCDTPIIGAVPQVPGVIGAVSTIAPPVVSDFSSGLLGFGDVSIIPGIEGSFDFGGSITSGTGTGSQSSDNVSVENDSISVEGRAGVVPTESNTSSGVTEQVSEVSTSTLATVESNSINAEEDATTQPTVEINH